MTGKGETRKVFEQLSEALRKFGETYNALPEHIKGVRSEPAQLTSASPNSPAKTERTRR